MDADTCDSNQQTYIAQHLIETLNSNCLFKISSFLSTLHNKYQQNNQSHQSELNTILIFLVILTRNNRHQHREKDLKNKFVDS